MNTNPHVVQPSYSTVLSGVPSHVTEMFSHHLRGGGWQNLPEATEEGVEAQSLGGPAPGRSAGEGPRVSVQASCLQARVLPHWPRALQARLFWPTLY